MYDHEGQRIKKQTNSGNYELYYGTLFDELYSSGGSLLKQTKYIYAGSQRVAMKDSSGNAYFIHADHLGSTHLMTNATTGAVVRTNKYYPFGGTFETSGTADDTHKYTGQVLDDNTGLYYYNARYYDPVLSQFITPDTIVQDPYDPQSLNRYSYCRNNPINNTDPTGNYNEPMFDEYNYGSGSKLDLSWRNSSIGNAFNTGWNYFAGNIVEPGINRFIENREQRLAEGRNLSFYSYSKLGLFERDAYDAAIGFMGGISVVGKAAGLTKGVEEFVHVAPKSVAKQIQKEGLSKDFSTYVTKEKYIQGMSAKDLERALYSKELQPFKTTKFDEGAVIFKIKPEAGVPQYKGLTNMEDKVRQWQFLHDVPGQFLEKYKIIK